MAKLDKNEVDDDLDEDKKPQKGEDEGKDALKEASKAEGDDVDDEPAEKSALELAAEAEEGAEAAELGTQDDAEAEKRRQAKRAERKARKLAARERQETQKRENEALRRRVEQLEQGQQHIHKRTTGHEVAQLDRAMQEVAATYKQAKAKRKEAMDKGDADGFEAADEVIQQCNVGYQRLKDVKARLQQQAERTGQVPNQTAIRLGQEWLAKRSWYQPDGDGEDTLVARVIDNKLAEEGTYDPGSPEYWAELDRRLEKRLPHRYKQKANQDEDDTVDDDDDVQERKPKRPGGPPTGGNGRDTGHGGGGRQDLLSAERVKAIKDAGKWDDPKARKKAIDNYQAYDRRMAAEGR